jgi:uncharacterized LabA/DUF88 family protein
MKTYAYIDASNLFYGGKKSLGWSIDYQKLLKYLKDKYCVSKVFFFGGVEIHKFHFDYLTSNTVDIKNLEKYLVNLIKDRGGKFFNDEINVLNDHLKRTRFYLNLDRFGYELIIKPVKTYKDELGNITKKANCDVDMAFYMMRDCKLFDRTIVLSGDGDFLPVLKYLKENKKEVFILSRGPRTAKEIRQFSGGDFRDFEYLRKYIEYENCKK